MVRKSKLGWKNIPKDISKYQGFIYYITNLTTGQFYIGKKFFWETEKRKPTKYLRKDGKYLKDKKGKRILNPRKNKIHIKKETDWKDYWGSCNELKKDIELLGKANFERKILKLCENKWDCAYYELLEQLKYDVLFNKDSYNEIINVRLRRRKP